MNWFEDWFDSPYYHILYKNRDKREAESFILALSQYLAIPKGSSILDIACGKGRHSVYLNQLGYKVTGVDLSSSSIAEAKKFENPNLNFEIHDMRSEYMGNSVDVVMNIFTSFGYFDSESEDQKCINSFANALKEKGTLVIDFINMPKAIQIMKGKEVKQVDGIEFSIEKKIEGNFLIKTINFQDNGRAFQFQERVRLLFKEDFLKYFKFAQLNLVASFGDYQLNEFDLHRSDRLILIAQK